MQRAYGMNCIEKQNAVSRPSLRERKEKESAMNNEFGRKMVNEGVTEQTNSSLGAKSDQN